MGLFWGIVALVDLCSHHIGLVPLRLVHLGEEIGFPATCYTTGYCYTKGIVKEASNHRRCSQNHTTEGIRGATTSPSGTGTHLQLQPTCCHRTSHPTRFQLRCRLRIVVGVVFELVPGTGTQSVDGEACRPSTCRHTTAATTGPASGPRSSPGQPAHAHTHLFQVFSQSSMSAMEEQRANRSTRCTRSECPTMPRGQVRCMRAAAAAKAECMACHGRAAAVQRDPYGGRVEGWGEMGGPSRNFTRHRV